MPPALARRVAESPELTEYFAAVAGVERELRRAPAPGAAPGSLAAGVLEQVRRRGPARPARKVRFGRLWGLAVAAGALGLLAYLGLPAGAPVSRPAVTAGWSAVARSPVEEPLIREARLLIRDARRAADMALAGFPPGLAGSPTARARN